MSSRRERIEVLNEADIFVPDDFLYNSVLPGVALTTALLSAAYLGFFYNIDKVFPSVTKIKEEEERKISGYSNGEVRGNGHANGHSNGGANGGGAVAAVDEERVRQRRREELILAKRRKAAFQATNLCANFVLAFLGLYYEILCWNPSFSNVGVEESVNGFTAYYPLSSFQAGYQFWSLPLGLLYVGESTSMIAHHIAVIVLCIMTGTFTNGFRYWTPFFYGIIEISSIPLSIMNTFKEYPQLVERYPTFNFYNRLTFAVSFLFFRVVVLVPRKALLVRDMYFLLSASYARYHTEPHQRWYPAICFFVALSCMLLLFLQLFWGFLISKGLFKLFFGPKEDGDGKKGETKSTSNGVADKRKQE